MLRRGHSPLGVVPCRTPSLPCPPQGTPTAPGSSARPAVPRSAVPWTAPAGQRQMCFELPIHVVRSGERTICLYYSGRAHAGENLATLLTQREADRGKPLGHCQVVDLAS